MARRSVDAISNDFAELVRRITHYNEALSVMFWDLRTGAPKKGVELRSEAIGTLSTAVFNMSTSPEMEQYLNELSEPDALAQLDEVHRANVLECKKDFDRNKKIPADRYQEYVVLTSKAESVWEDAKHLNDFAMFSPYLDQIVAMNIEFIGYWGHQENKYDTLLDHYEPGVTVRMLDEIFGDLREKTVSLLKRIEATGKKPKTDCFHEHFPASEQKAFSEYILRKMGYDFEAGRLDETVHPFEITMNLRDVRVTTRFNPREFRTALFGTIHEGGHALYEQGISPKLVGTSLCSGVSMGIHESQSRYWENIVGRSRAFWDCFYPELQKAFPSQFQGVSCDEYYHGINDVHPSLIRIEADELTYNLHIMLRYELEKGLINGDIRVADLPELWREKMKDYLGVVPSTDAEGVLQDVHWSGGSFGYFPSYSLGNIYAAQFANTIEHELPDITEQIRRGELLGIKDWLNENIHRYGKLLTPTELCTKVTGEPANAKYLVSYLETKFGALYGF